MSNTFYVIPKDSDLQHHGVLGMKWGIRRYQNADGSYTDAGRRRYFNSDGQLTSSGKAKQTADKIGQKGIQASLLSGIGGLIAGPLGFIPGLISGYAMTPEQTNKAARAGLGALTAEISAIIGFSSVSKLAKSYKDDIEAGKRITEKITQLKRMKNSQDYTVDLKKLREANKLPQRNNKELEQYIDKLFDSYNIKWDRID